MTRLETWILNMIKMARRQNTLAVGIQSVDVLIMSHKTKGKMVFLAQDIPQKISKKIEDRCETRNIPIYRFQRCTREELGAHFGKEKINVVGIDQESLVNGIQQRIRKEQEKGGP